jgi:hypothetical protein
LKEYGIGPEQLRSWTFYDVKLVQCASIASYINEEANRENEKNGGGDLNADSLFRKV